MYRLIGNHVKDGFCRKGCRRRFLLVTLLLRFCMWERRAGADNIVE